jgi:hypothetical protein
MTTRLHIIFSEIYFYNYNLNKFFMCWVINRVKYKKAGFAGLFVV